MDNVKKFGERLFKLREERGETQLQLAQAIGITRQSLSRYETNERTPNIDLIYSIAKHFNVSADYLLGLSDVQSVNTDIQTACKVTGLSEESISHLQFLKHIQFNYTADKIIKSPYFVNFIQECSNVYEKETEFVEKMIENDFTENIHSNNLEMDIDLYQYRAEKTAREMIEHIQPAYIQASLYKSNYDISIIEEQEFGVKNNNKQEQLKHLYDSIIENLEKERELNGKCDTENE